MDDTRLPEAAYWVGSYLEITRGLLLSHSCVIAQPEDEARDSGLEYEHPYRLVAPVVDLQSVAEPGTSAWDAMTKQDKIVQWMYLPPREGHPAGVALLHRATLVLHDNLGSRLAQMTFPGAQWLQVKLARLMTGTWLEKELFEPPMS